MKDRRAGHPAGAWGTAVLAGALLCAATVAQPARAQAASGPLLPHDSHDASVFRGGLVYANYCITCHGINADGNGRAARLYSPRPANLRASDKNNAYLALIIRKGGAALGRSDYMPTWEAELTQEQIGDVVAYLRTINHTVPQP